MQNPILNFYQTEIGALESDLQRKKKLNSYLYLVRFVAFVSFAALLFLFFTSHDRYILLLAAVFAAILFFLAVSMDLRNSYRIKFLGHKLSINKSEIRFLNHQYSERKTGEEFQYLNPHLADDFDIFGMGSLFQYLNRCSTRIGEQRFAETLCKSQLDENLIVAKQKAIKELSEKYTFTQDFQAYGMFVNEKGSETDSLLSWLDEKAVKLKLLRVLIVAVPLFNAAWIATVISGYFSVNSLLIPIILSMFIIFLNRKVIGRAHHKLGNTAKTFEKYMELIKLIENEKFESPYLADLQKNLEHQDTKASQSLKSLYKLLNSFDVRYNILASFILNSLVIFDIQVYCRLARWKELHKDRIPQWFIALAEMDALLGFSVFAFNNRDQVSWPGISSQEFRLSATDLGHPMLHPDVRVPNTVHFMGSPSVIIITGANMAGKSTFLRTLSVNLLMAMNGAPVCAKEFEFTPCDILSSIKIQDSLYKNESYFYAELLRIKEIMEHTRMNPRTLVVLDEILRGTNTKDKQTGSLGILEKLLSQNAVVVVATHDLVIGELENKYPDTVKNFCFEVELTNDQLIFDYKLKKGISQKLNASFLMKKLGII